MFKLLNKWLFYGLEEIEYKKSLRNIFSKNIINLCKINAAVAAMLIAFIIIISIVKPPAETRMGIPCVLLAVIIILILDRHIVKNSLYLVSAANKIKDERDNFFKQSITDELTQLKNRRDFFKYFKRVLANYRQMNNYLCIAILDIDYFKDYNDYYGHPKGDECLRVIGRAFKKLQENINIYIARIGGEEFALIWFEKEAHNAHNVASLVNETIRRLNIPHEKSAAAPYVTVSIGVYVVRCGISDDINKLYNLADIALYSAKKKGRNCAVVDFYNQSNIDLLRKTA